MDNKNFNADSETVEKSVKWQTKVTNQKSVQKW